MNRKDVASFLQRIGGLIATIVFFSGAFYLWIVYAVELLRDRT